MATVAARRADTASGDRLERIGFGALLAFVAALQFSIAIANIFLSVALLMWLLRLAARRAPFEAPDFFVPLVAYAAITLVSAAFSSDPRASFIDSKQLVLFFIVPMVYEFARGLKAPLVVQVIISVGAISAAVGVVQYGVLEYNNLGRHLFVSAERLPAHGRAAAGRRALSRSGAAADYGSVLLDVRPARCHSARSRRDAARGRADGGDVPADRRWPDDGRAALSGIS